MSAETRSNATKSDLIKTSLIDDVKLQPVAQVSANTIYDSDILAGMTRRQTLFGCKGWDVMSILGSIMYSAPIFVLMAGTSGVSTWHDLWGFAMGNVLPLGATIFLIGSILLGVATRRAGILPRNAGLLLIIGSSLWLVAFYIPVPFLLSLANLLSAGALTWLGVSLYPRTQSFQVQQAV